MPEKKRQNERLIAMLVFGVITLNYPLLSLFSKSRLFLGIPVLYLYIFSVWAVLIFCIAYILEKPVFSQSTNSLTRTEKLN